MVYKYKHVACGGTFDLLHRGHIALLGKAFRVSKFVSIGITTDKFCRKIGKDPHQKERQRRKNVRSFLVSKNLQRRAKIILLNDILGTTLADKTLEAIIVSQNTKRGAKEINRARIAKKLKKLKIVEIPWVNDRDNKIISTGRIRSGEISPSGAVFEKLLLTIAGKRFSQSIRTQLKKPFGKFIQDSALKNIKHPVITVGDVTTAKFVLFKIIPKLAIVDFLVNRQRVYENLHDLGFAQANPTFVVQNVPGQISKDLIMAVVKSYKSDQKQIILVEGEEDLAFIPALLTAPIPSIIFYGQPNKGLVKVDTTPDAKRKLCSLLQSTL